MPITQKSLDRVYESTIPDPDGGHYYLLRGAVYYGRAGSWKRIMFMTHEDDDAERFPVAWLPIFPIGVALS